MMIVISTTAMRSAVSEATLIISDRNRIIFLNCVGKTKKDGLLLFASVSGIVVMNPKLFLDHFTSDSRTHSNFLRMFCIRSGALLSWTSWVSRFQLLPVSWIWFLDLKWIQFLGLLELSSIEFHSWIFIWLLNSISEPLGCRSTKAASFTKAIHRNLKATDYEFRTRTNDFANKLKKINIFTKNY